MLLYNEMKTSPYCWIITGFRVVEVSVSVGAEVKNAWSYTSSPQYVFMTLCLV